LVAVVVVGCFRLVVAYSGLWLVGLLWLVGYLVSTSFFTENARSAKKARST
jgi:hypothetical protein